MHYTATYSPEDNKLRLTASSRLDPEEYARVKAAGFSWAPRQGIFVAPMWTPSRADLLIELAGEIGDEDTTLVDRAEERAERFEGYQESRTADAERATAAVDRICDGIPLGQPILVGHHSEKHARKDAERIENGMRKSIKMWETAAYWKSRAAGAIRHAKYKELPAVRHRRIKGLEADKRKQEKYIADSETLLKLWRMDKLTHEIAMEVCNRLDHISICFPLAEYPRELPASQYEGQMSLWSALQDGVITFEQARDIAVPMHERGIVRHTRWLDHFNNRLTYERAMLAEAGGLAADAFDIQIGGRILRRGEWKVVTKLNKRDGVLNSVTVLGHFANTVSVDEIREYKPPQDGDAEKVKAFTKLAPLCNYPGEGFMHMTEAEWKGRHKWSDERSTENHAATETHGAHRTRFRGGYKGKSVYLTDAKLVNPPQLHHQPVQEPLTMPARPIDDRPLRQTRANPLDAMRETLRAGIKVVSAPQLFPTPIDLAIRMVERANVQPMDVILEPSAGTGRILDAVLASATGGKIVAVEVNNALAGDLYRRYKPLDVDVRCANFLERNGDLGKFDVILMNPPFADGQDIAHIKHAITLLKPGGRLVAICANGPRQERELWPIFDAAGGSWEALPAESFKSSGTSVNAAMLFLEARCA